MAQLEDSTTTPSEGGPRTIYESHTTFKEFHISKSGLSNLELVCQTSSPEVQAYHVETSLYNPAKPDITIHAGTDAKGRVLGDVDLKNFSGHYTVELGDVEHEPVTLSELDRVKGWNSRHQFQFMFAGGKRETFVWRHPGEKLLSNRDDLELVTCGEEDDEEEVVLAQYLKSGGGGWKSRGRLMVREGGGRDWELMVVLTVVALVVSRRREQ